MMTKNGIKKRGIIAIDASWYDDWRRMVCVLSGSSEHSRDQQITSGILSMRLLLTCDNVAVANGETSKTIMTVDGWVVNSRPFLL